MYFAFFTLIAATLWPIFFKSIHASDNVDPGVLWPRNQAVREGGTAYFVFHAKGLVACKWKKNGKEITFTDVLNEKGLFDPYIKDGAALMVENVQLGRHNAHYECTCLRNFDYFKTAEVTLYIYDDDDDEIPPGYPNITLSPTSIIEVEKGSKVELKCAANGNPIPVFWWVKDRKPIQTYGNHRYVILNTTQLGDTLQITDFAESDAGTYHCVAENEIGTEFANPSKLMVRRDPLRFINTPPAEVEVMKGSDLNLTCEASADPMNPRPILMWQKDPDTQITSEPFPTLAATLELKRIQKTKNYTCYAKSGSDIIETKTQVKVQ